MRYGFLFYLSAVAGLAFSTAPVHAQQAAGRFGIGIGVATSSVPGFHATLAPTVYLPILAGDRLMIEPGFGLRYRNEESDEGREKASAVAVGAGILFLVPMAEDDRFYLGPRVGLIRTALTTTGSGNDVDETELNLSAAAVAGGEFFFRPGFSLGAETGLRWVRRDLEAGNDGSSFTSTTVEIRGRWYLP